MPPRRRNESYRERGLCPSCGKVNVRALTHYSCLSCSTYRTRHAKENPEQTKVWKDRYEREKRTALLDKRVEEGRCRTCGRMLLMGEETLSCKICCEKGEFNFKWN